VVQLSLLGKLAVAVVGDTSGLTSSLADAKKQVGAFNKDVQKSGVSLQNVGKVMAATGAAIVGTLTAITTKTASYAEKVDMMAQKTGMTTDEVQKLDYVLKLSNTSMDAVSKSMGIFSKNIESASEGGKKASAAFENIGISTKNLNLKSVSTVLLDVADKFAKMPDGAVKTASALNLFGKAGADLIPVLNQGRDGIERLMKEAEDLGVVIDEQSIKSLAAYDDNLDRIKASMGGLTMQIAATVAPAFEKLSGAIVGLLKWINQLNPNLRAGLTILVSVAGAIGLVGGAFVLLIPKIYAARVAMLALNTSFAPFAIGTAIVIGLSAIIGKIKEVADESRNAKKAVDELANAGEVASAKSGVTKDLLMVRDSIRRITEGEAINRNLASRNGVQYKMDSRTKNELDNLRRRERDLEAKIDAIDKRGKQLSNPYGSSSAEYTCPYCEKSFKSLSGLDSHMKVHGGSFSSGGSNQEDTSAADNLRADIDSYLEAWKRRQENIEQTMREESESEQQMIEDDKEAYINAWQARQENITQKMEEDAQAEQQAIEDYKTALTNAWQKRQEQIDTMLNAEPKERQTTWAQQYLAEMKTLSEQASDYAYRTAQDVQYALGDSIYAGVRGKWEDIGDAIKNVLENILKNMSNMLASQIMRGFMEKFGNAIYGLYGNHGPQMGAGYVQGEGLSFTNGLSHRASGGPVSAFAPYLVGEQGPELFIPGSSGQIVSNDKLGANVQVNVINQSGIQMTAKQGQPQVDLKKIIVPVIMEAAADNTMGFRDMLKSR
jgi:hypothetical protein